MFDIGWPELMLIMVVALVVIGPKDLPAAIRTVTTILRKVRGMAAEFQSGLQDIAREAGVDDIKNSIDDIVTYDPKDALDNIAEIDDGEFSFDDDGNPTSDNSILDPEIQSRMFNDDPDAAAVDTPEPVVEPKSEPATPADGDVSTAANEDEPAPRPAAPATAPASGNS
ncbi:MAG: Sec-independent protein translocase protein TatB [Alphaproteobacteria bacterium]|nr:Sec-independent protein translocase protein TatB [Alphaproteobacteria bacterium]